MGLFIQMPKNHEQILKEIFHNKQRSGTIYHHLFLEQKVKLDKVQSRALNYEEVETFKDFMVKEFPEELTDFIIVFDTSSLLNLLTFSENQFNKFKDGMQNLRVVIPIYVVREFKDNINAVVDKNEFKKKQQDMIGNLTKIINSGILVDFKNLTTCKEEIENIKNVEATVVKDWVISIYNNKPDYFFDADTQEEITKKGLERYKREFPPGYGDKKAKNGLDAYMDLFIWKKVLELGKDSNVFFVTDDEKEKCRSGATLKIQRAEFTSLNEKQFFQLPLMFFFQKYIMSIEKFTAIKNEEAIVKNCNHIVCYNDFHDAHVPTHFRAEDCPMCNPRLYREEFYSFFNGE